MSNLVPVFLFLCVGCVSLFSFIAIASWSEQRRREREAFYRSETIKKIAERADGGEAALEFLREQERMSARRIREGQKLGGMITTGVGVGLLIFLRALIPGVPIYLCGLFPLFVGVALLSYAYVLGPKVE